MSEERAKKQRRSPHQTQWAAQFAVASELCKRGYEVAFTMGNHPRVDLMVISPHRETFLVDVKGLYKKNCWLVRKHEIPDKLFYIFAFVPDGDENQFFILTEAQANEGILLDLKKTKARQKQKGLVFDEARYPSSIEWSFALSHKDQWEALPE